MDKSGPYARAIAPLGFSSVSGLLSENL